MSNREHEPRLPAEHESLVIDRLYCDGVCVTCADEALPARVLSVGEETGLALVEMGGAITEVDVTLMEAVAPGDWVLTQGGVALGRLEKEPTP